METVTIELKNKKARKLLEELEELDIIKMITAESSPIATTTDKATKYNGFLSKATADAMLKYVEETRNEWEERFATK